MNESEATVMRLTEQASVLKAEIRRLERNQERERETQNLEYLKNIVLKVRYDMGWLSAYLIFKCNRNIDTINLTGYM